MTTPAASPATSQYSLGPRPALRAAPPATAASAHPMAAAASSPCSRGATGGNARSSSAPARPSAVSRSPRTASRPSAAPLQRADAGLASRRERRGPSMQRRRVEVAQPLQAPATEDREEHREQHRGAHALGPRRACGRGDRCHRRRSMVGVARGAHREHVQREQLQQHAELQPGRHVTRDQPRHRPGHERSRVHRLRHAHQVERHHGAPRQQQQQCRRVERTHVIDPSGTGVAVGRSCPAISAPSAASSVSRRCSSGLRYT